MKLWHFFIWFLICGVVFIWWIVWLGFYLSPQDPKELSEVIVVVSGGETRARAFEGIKLYQQGWAPKIIFSGAARDQDQSGVSNAEAMSRLAQKQGVATEDIVLEESSRTTWENAIEVTKILKNHGWRKLILVTSPYHQKRAKMTFSYILGDNYTIISRSAEDSIWRKNGWWKTWSGWYLSLSEFQKIIFIYSTGNYQ